MNIDNEYILIVNLSNQYKIYRVYALNEKIALNKYKNMCQKYMNTQNIGHRNYWKQLKDAIDNNKFTIYKSEDYCGVREIL